MRTLKLENTQQLGLDLHLLAMIIHALHNTYLKSIYTSKTPLTNMSFNIEFTKTVRNKTLWVISTEDNIFAISLYVYPTEEHRFLQTRDEYWISTDNVYDIQQIVQDPLKPEDYWMHP